MKTIQSRVDETKLTLPTCAKLAESAQIERDIAEFQLAGGTITRVGVEEANFLSDMQKGNKTKYKSKYGARFHVDKSHWRKS